MIRKALSIISMLALGVCSFMANASDWYKYPIYSDNIDDVVETSSKVYYLSGGNLFSFSPSDQESYAYTHLNQLNDQEVQDLYYNNDKKYLLVVYTDSNIDVILDSGKVINMPDIKDSSVSDSRRINDVAFGEDRIAIATDFGIVVYNDDKFEVIESGIYNKIINSIGIMNGNLLIYGHYATEFKLMYSPLNTRHNTLDKFKVLFGFAIDKFRIINDDILAFRENITEKVFVRKINFDDASFIPIVAGEYAYNYPFKKYKDGFYTLTEDKILTFDDNKVNLYDLPSDLRGQKIGFYESPSKVWAGDAAGIANYDISSGNTTVLYDKLLFDG